MKILPFKTPSGVEAALADISEEEVKSFSSSVLDALRGKFLPKNKKGKIGIIIAVDAEDVESEKRLQNDLLIPLKQYFSTKDNQSIFWIVDLPIRENKKIKDFQTSLKYLEKTKSHYAIYGNLRKRMHDGKVNYVFNLDGSVRHAPVPMFQSNILSNDFRAKLPKIWNFPQDQELFGFEVAADLITNVTKYIIGVAAYLSGDYSLAFKLYADLSRELKETENPQLLEIKKSIPKRMVEVSNSILFWLYVSFNTTRDRSFIKRAEQFIPVLEIYDPGNYQFRVFKSLYLFLIKGDVRGSIKILKKTKNPSNDVYLFNMAFLYAYDQDLKKAKKCYDKISLARIPPNILAEVEVFMSEVIEKEENNTGLYFARGYLNFKFKQDLALARVDLEKFVSGMKGKSSFGLGVANSLLNEIRSK